MAKLKYTQILIEGSDEAIVDAIRGHFHQPAPAAAVELDETALLPPAPPPDLPAPAGEEEEPPKPARKYVRRKDLAPAVNDHRQATGGSTPQDLVLAQLKKRPMSALELIEATGLKPPQVYNATNQLKNKEQIEGREDPVDGTRRWFLRK